MKLLGVSNTAIGTLSITGTGTALAVTNNATMGGSTTYSAQSNAAVQTNQTASNWIIANKLLAGDTIQAIQIWGDGRIQWGPGGNTPLDTNLYRLAGGALKTDGVLIAGTYLDLSTCATTIAATGGGIGDKIALYSSGASGYGFGLQASRLVAYVPSSGGFSVRAASGTGNASSGADVFSVTGGGALNVTGAGDTTIGSAGTSTSSTLFQVLDSTNTATLRISGSSGNVYVGTGSNAGNLGVGTATTSHRLEVSGTAAISGALTVSGGSATTAAVSSTTGLIYGKASVFHAYTNGGTQSLSVNTWTKATIATKVFDTETAFSTSTNNFTAPRTGYYRISGGVSVQIAAAQGVLLAIRVNDLLYNGSYASAATQNVVNPGAFPMISDVIFLNANDTCSLWVYATYATTVTNTHFSGQFIGT